MDDRAAPGGVDAGTLVAAAGAIALLVGLFLDWYSPGSGGAFEGASAWTVFEIVDLLLAVLAIAVLLAVLSALAPGGSLPELPSATVAVAGVAALVLVTVSLVDDPPAASGASLEEGIWISFGGAVLMVLGAVLERSRIRLVVTPRDDLGPDDYDEPADADETAELDQSDPHGLLPR